MQSIGGMGFVELFKRLILFGDQDRSLQDILLVYVFFFMIVLTSISTIINVIIGIPFKVIWFDFVVIFGFLLFYILTNITNKFTQIRRLFLVFTFISVGFLWLNSQGSSGPSVLLLQSLAVVLVFISVGKEFIISFVSLVFITILLYMMELFLPDIAIEYESKGQKLFDNLSMVLLIFAFQIPILTYARNVLFKERAAAISNAEEKSCFLAQMSHEIRTPMNAILGFVELLDDPTIEEEEHSSYLKIISQNSRILLNLLNNAININKINSGQTQVFISKCNANALINYVSETLKTLSTNNDVKVVANINTSEDALLEVDENLVYQILINLGFNAIKFTKQGEVVLSWKKENGFITFLVKDTGCGIAESEQQDIFNIYAKAQNKEVIVAMNGAGLGLHICKSLTELLKGEIWFNSIEGVGSEFFVKFPENNL